MADHHHLQALGMMARGLVMDLGHQRAGRVHVDHVAPPRLGRHRLGHPMGGKDHRAVIGNVVQFLDKDRALVAQAVHDELVVDDLVADINGGAPFLQRQFDDLDGTVHARAKSARRGKIQHQGRFRVFHGPEVARKAALVQRHGRHKVARTRASIVPDRKEGAAPPGSAPSAPRGPRSDLGSRAPDHRRGHWTLRLPSSARVTR